MIELHKNLKEIYKDYVILMIKGNFVETFNKDAIVINGLIGYKLMVYKKYIKIGFRIDYKNKVFYELEKSSINYIVWQENIIDVVKYKTSRYNELSL